MGLGEVVGIVRVEGGEKFLLGEREARRKFFGL